MNVRAPRCPSRTRGCRRTVRVLFGLALAAIAIAADCAPALAKDRILLIGNSFTEGIRPRLRAIMRSAGRDSSVGVRAVNGWTLAHHAASGSTTRKIGAASWNAVVLQEQSKGIFLERYPSARYLDAEIAGRTVFFMTWRDREAVLEDYDTLLGVPGGNFGYVPIADELDAAIAPVGWAFREVLLRESDPDLWSLDGHHASERGRYLASLVLYATIFGESPFGLWFPSSIGLEQAFEDQVLVEEVVLGNAGQWNIDVAVPAAGSQAGDE